MNGKAVILLILGTLLCILPLFVRWPKAKTRGLKQKLRDSLRAGNIPFAAMLLEGAGRPMDAARLLIGRGLPLDACRILMRHNQFLLAGQLYTRVGEWEEAVQCFMLGNENGRAAVCAVEAKDYATAAELYRGLGQPRLSAQCYVRAGNFKMAGRAFVSAGEVRDAAEMYLLWSNVDPEGFQLGPFEDRDLNVLFQHCLGPQIQEAFLSVLDRHGKSTNLIAELLRARNTEAASKVLLKIKAHGVVPLRVTQPREVANSRAVLENAAQLVSRAA